MAIGAPPGLGAAGGPPTPTPPGLGGAGAGKSPMPGSLSGGPAGPGGSPVTSPGGGAGNKAAADALVKAMIPGLHKALSAYPPESKEYKAVLRALSALTANFKGAEEESMVPAALLQLAQAQKSGARPAAPPMPIQARPPSPLGGAAGAPPI